MRHILLTALGIIIGLSAYSQGCCSGGSGSPIAGGFSQGVLREKQVEFAANYRYSSSNKFLVEDRDTVPLFDELSSKYLYFRAGYGITEKLTLELSFGYFFDKRLVELEERNSDDIATSGFGDLLIFPRYDVYFKSSDTKKTEVTIGLGYKIPLGSNSDSTVVFENPETGEKYYTIAAPTVQPSNGSQDVLLYLFGLRAYPQKKLNFFANALYIHKGYNSLGQKFGNYSSVGLFASKTFFRKLGVTTQIKGEFIGKMKSAKNINQVVYYNIDPESTGSKKMFFIPQLSYTFQQVTFYGLTELPLYQYVNGNQVASGTSITFGISYRFSKFCDLPVMPLE
ncbi:MAG: hypothetical protein K9H49_01765 [Bacteroidales bacterium]|nr:hypothetical protein [Bacteroidales bacterium]MCF8404652.1 hypothetical protein [Bacteroidales bacterium]